MQRQPLGGPSAGSSRREPAVCGVAGAPHGVDDAALDRSGRPRPGRRARPHRRGAPLRRGARHQVRDVRRAARARRDDRRAAPRRLAARRAPRRAASSRPRAKQLRRELGAEPTLADLAARVGSDEARLERTIVRISTIESTSPLSAVENVDSATLPAVLVPSEPPSPDSAYEAARSARSRPHRARVAAGARAQGSSASTTSAKRR